MADSREGQQAIEPSKRHMSYPSHYDIMTHSHFDTWHHNKISKARRANNMTRDSKSVNLTHFWRLSICNLFSRNTSHSHDNLRRVSKSPLLHPFTSRRSGTLNWRVTKATSADSSRLIHTILAHSSLLQSLLLHSLLHLSIFQSFIAIGHILIFLYPSLRSLLEKRSKEYLSILVENTIVPHLLRTCWLWIG
jgi:hypothetical protein